MHLRGEWPSGLNSLRQVTEVKLGRVRSDSGWVILNFLHMGLMKTLWFVSILTSSDASSVLDLTTPIVHFRPFCQVFRKALYYNPGQKSLRQMFFALKEAICEC